MSLDVLAIPWSVSNGDKWEAHGMVAADGREKPAPLDDLARVLGNALFSHAYKLCYAEPGVSARRFALSRGFNVLSIMTYAVDTLLSDSVDCGSIECCNFSLRSFSNTT